MEIHIFYGYSGNLKGPLEGWTAGFPDGTDRNHSHRLCAETLKTSLEKRFVGDRISVHQCWHYNVLIQKLTSAVDPIRQVHIITHGDSTRLSLAYKYDDRSRERDVARFTLSTANVHGDDAAVITGYAMCPNINQGLLREFYRKADSHDEPALVPSAAERKATFATLRNKVQGSQWQIWACYSGYRVDHFGSGGGLGDAELDTYLQRYNSGRVDLPGIARELAMELEVDVTAAYGGGGLEFWHGDRTKTVNQNGRKTPAQVPFWVWNTRGSKWQTFDKHANVKPKPLLLGNERDASELPTPKPPPWLTDLFWS